MFVAAQSLYMKNALLIFNPIPIEYEISNEQIEEWKQLSIKDLGESGSVEKRSLLFY